MEIAVAQLNYKIGDFDGNLTKISRIIQQYGQHVDLIIFSELCLSGYYPKDLITSPAFIQAQEKAKAHITQLAKTTRASILYGFIDKNTGKGKPFFNALNIVGKNTDYIYHKKLLPMYNIFNEARHFEPGRISGVCTFQDTTFGVLICEDGWANEYDTLYPHDPIDELSQANAEVILCINGSPSNVGKQEDRMKHFSSIAKRCHAPLIFVNQVGGNDDIVFDGASFLLDSKGALLGNLPTFEEAVGTLTLSNTNITPLNGFAHTLPLSIDTLRYEQCLLGLKDYIHKCGFKHIVIGVSGGIDSAITLALAVKALGHKNVHALAMPSRYSSESSLKDAKALCNIFNVQLTVISIEEEFTLALAQFEKAYREKAKSITEQNIQARIRGRLLMEFSNQTGALVLSTGNKSELSVGYTTLYGDMTGGFNLIGDLYKTEVYELARFFNQHNPDTPIPENIITKSPSAELQPNQQDSDTLPEYALLDPILKLYIEGDLLPPEEASHYQAQIKSLPSTLIARIHSMVDNAEFKRRQSAPIIRLQRRAFGFGRQLPIAATYPQKQD